MIQEGVTSMRRILAAVATLLFGTGLLISDGMSASIPGPLTVDTSIIWLAQTPAPQTGPVAGKPLKRVKKPPPGACEATRGQTGPCRCSTSAGATGPTCTGNCCGGSSGSKGSPPNPTK